MPDNIAQPHRALGIGIIGCGHISGAYAADIAANPEVMLVAVTDLDPARATAFAEKHGCRAHASAADLLADDSVELVINLTVHHAHFDVTSQALEAGRHVYSEKPMALEPGEARQLVELAARRGVRLGCAPMTFLGEAQQTVGALLDAGRVGTIRAIYAEVNWGRIESWHPAPEPFYDVGVMVDVGVYPLTIVTAFFGPVRSVDTRGWYLQPKRAKLDGGTFSIGSPDFIVSLLELASGPVFRLTTSFYVGKPVKQQAQMEFHGDAGSIALESFQNFDAAVEAGRTGGDYENVPYVRAPYPGTAWARGAVDMAQAIRDGRPHRVTGEQAAHVVDILAAARESMRSGTRFDIESTFAQPALMDWAKLPPGS